MKFKLGDIVKVKDDLVIGGVYFMNDSRIGDKFTSQMRKNTKGKEAKIIRIKSNGGYILDIDRIHTYYDDMLEYPHDIAEDPYVFNSEVESLVTHMKGQHYKKLIDKALDERLHKTNPEAFNKLYNLYKQYV